MRKQIILALLLVLAFSKSYAFEITEDDQYVYTKRGLSELPDKRLRNLMNHFYDQLTDQLNSLGVPTDWTDESQELLIGNQDRFTSLINETQGWAKKYLDDENVNLDDLIPTGFIVGLGVNGSGELLVGMGGGAMLTLIVVPIEVEEFNKITRETRRYVEASWSIGGLAQWGVGAGTGGGLAARGAFGLIWGSLPEADDLTGVAIGVNGTVSFIQGIGLKAAVLFNTTTHHHNLIAMVTIDIGVTSEASVEASMSYFMSAKHIIGFISGQKIQNSAGIYKLIEDENSDL